MDQTRDPLRWIDDPAIDPALREAVRATRDVAPSFDRALGLARLESAISAGPGMTGALLTGAALGFVVIAGIAWWGIEHAPSDRAPAAVPRDVEVVPHGERASAPAAAPIATSVPAIPAPTGEPAEAASEAHAEALVPPRRRDRDEAPDDALTREIAQLADARRTLTSDPAGALALLDDGRARYPSSMFGEERDALRVLALSALHRDDEARTAGDRFLAAHPASPFAERIRRALSTSTR